MTPLRKLQLVELDLLREVDRICRKHGLQYQLCAGTLLGAVRHKGFIPWDDDLDISMPFGDYKKFCEICRIELDVKKYFLQTMDTDEHYRYIFAKFRRQNTLYVRKGQEHMKHHHGICIDIFPLYPVPENMYWLCIFSFIVARCKTIMWSPVGAASEKQRFLRMIYKFLSVIPARIPLRIIEFLVSKYGRESMLSIGAPSFEKKWGWRRHLNVGEADMRNVFEHLQDRMAVELDFEGMKCFAPANYHYKLTYVYGDYMSLPPENERSGHHHASNMDFGDFFDDCGGITEGAESA